MLKPDSQSLYVMQNDHGLIKIGRSLNPEARRRALSVSEKCGIALVLVLPGQGWREESVHIALDEHRIEGEWFEGHEVARAAIAKAVKSEAEYEWPYPFNAETADAWLGAWLDKRDKRALEKMFYRILERLRLQTTPSLSIDADICQLKGLSETGELLAVRIDKVKGQQVVNVYRNGQKKPDRQPSYSSNLEAAMGLWIDSGKPEQWVGTPLECAVAAMEDRYRFMLWLHRNPDAFEDGLE